MRDPNDLRPTIVRCQATDSIPPQVSRKEWTIGLQRMYSVAKCRYKLARRMCSEVDGSSIIFIGTEEEYTRIALILYTLP